MRRPLAFLPLFFIALGMALAAAITWRAYSYAMRRTSEAAVPTPSSPASNAPPASSSSSTQAVAPEPGGKEAPVTAPAGRPRAASTPSPASSDERGGPPAGPDSTAPQRSLLSRILAPVAAAVTGGAPAQADAVQPKSAPQSASQSTSSRTRDAHASEASRNTGTSTAGSTSTAEKDPSSDTQPPQLVSASFNPPQVHDGEETMLVVQAVDDLAGIRSISGTVQGPAGGAQGFACQREGETDRYLARITVPKDAADGVWRVNYLSLIDFASNPVTLSGAQVPSSASFRVVSSASDSQGPTLRAIWLDREAMRAGEKNTVFVDASDDKSGLGLISGVFLSPAKQARVGFVCRAGDGPWACEFVSPDCVDCGDWHLEQLQMQDKANNVTTVRGDNPVVARVVLNIVGDRCDATPPVLQGLTLDRNTVSNTQESPINVTAFASDDTCGTMSMTGQVTGPSTGAGAPRLYFSLSPAGDAWSGQIVVPRLAAKGTWRVTWIQLLDHAHNLKTYNSGDPALGTAVFQVH